MSGQTNGGYNPRANEGLPTADDYDPSAIGSANIEAGESTQVWEEYGLEMVPVMCDGEDTGRRLIRRNGDFIADVTDRYQLLPNERAVEAANEVARDLGATPFHEFDGDWFVQLDDHVFQDTERRRVHALYAWDTGTIGGDEMEYGFAVHNSIDTSLGFRVALFSFRHACQNMVNIGIGNSRESFALGVESERDILSSDMAKHTSGLEVDVDALKSRIQTTLSLVDGVDETYRQWHQESMTPEMAHELVSRRERAYLSGDDVPEWVDAIADDYEEARENESINGANGLTEDRKRAIINDHLPHQSKWEVYNSLTRQVWHNDGTSDTTKRRKEKQVHAVFDPLESLEG